MAFRLDSKTWAQQHFADCQLGDKRRTKRLIKMAEQVSDVYRGVLAQKRGVFA